MKRVLFTGVYSHLHGGLERFAERAAELLRGNGHSVEVVGDPPSELKDYDFVLMHKVPRTIADLRRLKARYGDHLFFYAHDHELYCLRRHYYSPSRVNCERMYSPIPCRLCAAITRPKWVMRALTRPMRQFLDEMSEVKAFAGGAYMKRNLVRSGMQSDRIFVLPPFFVDTSGLPDITDRKWMPDGRLRILFMGQLIAGKGCGLLLEAVRELEERGVRLSLTIVGSGKDETHLRAMAGKSVHFMGWQDNAQRFFADADVCAFPSLWNEPYGMTGSEALAHGVPVVAFDVGGIRDWLSAGRNGFLAESISSVALADALMKCANPDILAKMGLAALETTRRIHGIDNFLDTIEKAGGLK